MKLPDFQERLKMIKMLSITASPGLKMCDGLASHPGGSSNIPGRLMQDSGYVPAWWAT